MPSIGAARLSDNKPASRMMIWITHSIRIHNLALLVLLQAVLGLILRPPNTKRITSRDCCDNFRLHSSASDLQIDRRSCVTALILGSSTLFIPDTSCAESNALSSRITLPLEPASGGTFCVRCTIFGIDTSRQVYRTIVDTGSPYLVLPFVGNEKGKKTKQRFKQVNDDDDAIILSPSEYPSTSEIYGAVKGNIDWKLATYSFRDPRLQIQKYKSQEITNAGVIGVLDKALTDEATGGGTIRPYGLLGLIQNSNPYADRSRFPESRPTFFEQECIVSDDTGGISKENKRIKSFCMNTPERELTFSTESLLKDQSNTMKLVDLRKYGDFVDHYAVEVQTISFDGVEMSTKGIKRPIVAVFDSGLTGCLLIRPFWDFVQKYYAGKSISPDARDFHSVSIVLKEMSGAGCRMESSAEDDPRQFYVDPIDLDWFDDEATAPYAIILGQTFLSQGALTIDMEQRLSHFCV